MEYKIANSIDDAWSHWYTLLAMQNKEDSSRDGEVCGEVINAVTVIKDPTQNILKSPVRKLPMRYAVGELLWYLSGSDSLHDIKQYSKAWENLSDDGAVIHIKDADNKPTKDTPCTVSLQFLIRDNKLHLTVYMRSNDIWLGFPYDVFSFTCMQIKMAMELGYDVGEYTHIAGSLHLYTRNKKEG